MAFILPKSVMIHTPKTGGLWMERALAAAGLKVSVLEPKHSTFEEVMDHPKVKARRGRVFTFVRHPLTWYPSHWVMRNEHGWHNITDTKVWSYAWLGLWTIHDHYGRHTSFREYARVCTTMWGDHGWYQGLVQSFTRGLDMIGKQENLIDDLVNFLHHCGEEFDEDVLRNYPRYNVRASAEHPSWDWMYDQATVDAVVQSHQWVIDMFEYPAVPPEIYLKKIY